MRENIKIGHGYGSQWETCHLVIQNLEIIQLYYTNRKGINFNKKNEIFSKEDINAYVNNKKEIFKE